MEDLQFDKIFEQVQLVLNESFSQEEGKEVIEGKITSLREIYESIIPGEEIKDTAQKMYLWLSELEKLSYFAKAVFAIRYDIEQKTHVVTS